MGGERESTLELMLDFDKRGGLIPAIAQDYQSKEILMLAYVNKQAFEKTLELGYATFWSTSRNELWTKGLTSGDKLLVKAIFVDCDQDAIVYQVEREGSGACHTRDKQERFRRTCFYRMLKDGKLEFISGLE